MGSRKHLLCQNHPMAKYKFGINLFINLVRKYIKDIFIYWGAQFCPPNNALVSSE